MPDNPDDSKGHENLFDKFASTEKDTSTKSSKDSKKSEIDWDSDDNPYKKRAEGHQRKASEYKAELDGVRGSQEQLSQIIAGLESINSRMDGVEDMAAEAVDIGGARDSDDGDDDDSQSQKSTNARQDQVRTARQKRSTTASQTAHAAEVNEVKALIDAIYIEQMRTDPRIQAVAAEFNEAVKDPSKRAQLWRAYNKMRDFATEFAKSDESSESDDSKSKDSDKSSSQDSKDDASKGSSDDGDEKVDDKPTKRERLIESTSTQGQNNSGSSPGVGDDSLSPLEMIEKHMAGEKTEAGV